MSTKEIEEEAKQAKILKEKWVNKYRFFEEKRGKNENRRRKKAGRGKAFQERK